MRVSPTVVAVIALSGGCGRESTTTESTCTRYLGEYCQAQPNACPTSASEQPFCRWLTGQGGRFYAGPAGCPGLGVGWAVESPDGATALYLFDDAGLTAIVDGRDGACGPAVGSTSGGCYIVNVGYGCATDAGRE